MSQSRSPTPSHYHSSNTHTQSTISRPHPLDEQDHAKQATASTSRLDTPPPNLAATPSSSGPKPQSLKRKGRAETDSSFDANTPTTTEDSPMAKRMKHDSPQPRGASRRADRSSPSSSDSQDADTESEATVGATSKMEQAEQSVSSTLPGAAPPKKKRTRTLTTPHQSAVLHALLAQVSILGLAHQFCPSHAVLISIVSFSDDSHARGSRTFHWPQRAKSTGM